MRLTRFQRYQAYSVLVALVVGGLGYPLAHAVEHYVHDCTDAHEHLHRDAIAFSAEPAESDHHGLDCSQCPALSPSLGVLGAKAAASTGSLQVTNDSTVLPIVVSVHYTAPPRAPPHQA